VSFGGVGLPLGGACLDSFVDHGLNRNRIEVAGIRNSVRLIARMIRFFRCIFASAAACRAATARMIAMVRWTLRPMVMVSVCILFCFQFGFVLVLHLSGKLRIGEIGLVSLK